MKVNSFEDILVWQKSKVLSLVIYKLFRYHRDLIFRDQIIRAGISIMNNIAEGFERKGNKEFSKFLYIAKGSSAEVRSMLYLALELNYINKAEFDQMYMTSLEISKMLSGFIKTL